MTIEELMDEGLSFLDATMALEAYNSSRIEGAEVMTAKRLVKLINGSKSRDASQ